MFKVPHNPSPADSPLGVYSNAAVSADASPCAQVAGDILRQNGTAADAAIAGLFCIGIINPHLSGVGGGFLLTFYQKSTGNVYCLNSREMAPSAAHKDMFGGNETTSQIGPLAIAVPGEVRGYYELYQRFGGLVSWRDLIQPSIDLCLGGFPVNWHLASALQQKEQLILNEPTMSVFVNPATQRVWQEGDILQRPKLAGTLQILQEDPDSLYTGELSLKLVSDLQSIGSIITAEDLRNYNPVWQNPVKVTLQNKNLDLYSFPPPGSGIVMEFILNVLDNYQFTNESLNVNNTVVTHQRFVEAMKYAYAKRTELADPFFVNMDELVTNMTSESYASTIFNSITDDMTFQDPEHYGANITNANDHGTSHLSLVAPNGDAIAVTSTVNFYFGAVRSSVQTDVVLNNEMDDFSSPNITNGFGVPPSEVNYIYPGKRPVSSMAPAVTVDSSGNAVLTIGAAGGTKITSAIAWTAMRNLWFGENIKEATDARRLHHQLFPMILMYQEGFDPNIVTGLYNIGHVTEEYGVESSAVGGIGYFNGNLEATYDFRKPGQIDGF